MGRDKSGIYLNPKFLTSLLAVLVQHQGRAQRSHETIKSCSTIKQLTPPAASMSNHTQNTEHAERTQSTHRTHADHTQIKSRAHVEHTESTRRSHADHTQHTQDIRRTHAEHTSEEMMSLFACFVQLSGVYASNPFAFAYSSKNIFLLAGSCAPTS